ncbi:MAG: MscL family protein [archaeon]
MKVASEFREFLKEYKVLGLAIAFIIGVASKDLVNSLVENIVMPFMNPLIPHGTWETATMALGPVSIKWGAFLGSAINFLIIAVVVFVIAKKILREEKAEKKQIPA